MQSPQGMLVGRVKSRQEVKGPTKTQLGGMQALFHRQRSISLLTGLRRIKKIKKMGLILGLRSIPCLFSPGQGLTCEI